MPISPEKHLEKAVGRYGPDMEKLARGVLRRVRERCPGAVEMVWDKKNAIVVGFGPTEKPSDAVFSVVVYPKWVLLYFLNGAVIPDPDGLLQGAGKVGRHIRLMSAEKLDEAAVKSLMDDAIELSGAEFGGKRKVILRQATAGGAY
jgi:hypothetical protein